MNKFITALVLAACTVPALAASPAAKPAPGIDTGRLFVGAGLSDNDVPGSDNGTGFQFCGGYEFGQVAHNVAVDLEVGYMDTGNMDMRPGSFDARAKGLWATGVGRLQLNPQFELLARAGLDFGDDDGLMVGIGAGFNVNKQTQLRLEFVERDDVSSLQFNFVYRP